MIVCLRSNGKREKKGKGREKRELKERVSEPKGKWLHIVEGEKLNKGGKNKDSVFKK